MRAPTEIRLASRPMQQIRGSRHRHVPPLDHRRRASPHGGTGTIRSRSISLMAHIHLPLPNILYPSRRRRDRSLLLSPFLTLSDSLHLRYLRHAQLLLAFIRPLGPSARAKLATSSTPNTPAVSSWWCGHPLPPAPRLLLHAGSRYRQCRQTPASFIVSLSRLSSSLLQHLPLPSTAASHMSPTLLHLTASTSCCCLRAIASR